MALLVTDPWLEARLKAERRQAGSDGHDEVWDGLYVMPPLPDDTHQEIQGTLMWMFRDMLGWDSDASITPGVNISDRREDWEFDFRAPDVTVYLAENPAENCGTHRRGGADFLAEILTPGDRSREKLPFYGKVRVREALYIDRGPWGLELYGPGEPGQVLRLVANAAVDGPPIASRVFPLAFKLIAGDPRPQIEVTRTTDVLTTRGGRNRWFI